VSKGYKDKCSATPAKEPANWISNYERSLPMQCYMKLIDEDRVSQSNSSS